MQNKFLSRLRLVALRSLLLNNWLGNLNRPISRRRGLFKFNVFQKFVFANFLGFQTVRNFSNSMDLGTLKNDIEGPKSNVKVYILQSDEYFKVGKYQDSYKTLKYFEESNDAEVLWRMARALYNMSKLKQFKQSEVVQMIEEAYMLASRALEIDPNNYAVHKWMAITMDAKFTMEGTSARIKALPAFKEHLLRAMELNPKDATTIYILGQYCYNIASMPWYQRKIASAVFGKPPEATFEEALYYFSKAEEAEPNFYSLNLLMLGKSYLQVNKIEAAHYWLRCASTYPIRTDEDKEVRKEAEELLKKYAGVNESFGDKNNYKNNE